MESYTEKQHANVDDSPEAAADARDFLGSVYLSKDDLAGETPVRLVNVQPESLPGAARRKLVAQLEGYEKKLILNSTNLMALASLFGTTNTAHWRGEVTLSVDPNVTYAGKRVGGIRVKPVQPAAPKPQNGAGYA